MKIIMMFLCMALSANARWESTHFRNGDLVLFNTETGQAYHEYQETMIPLPFAQGTEVIDDTDGKKYVVPKFPAELTPQPPKKK